MKRPVRVTLTIAQLKMFDGEIEAGRILGDCEMDMLTLVIPDYEAAQAMLNRFFAVQTKTTREYVTWASVIDRVNALIVQAAA